MKNKGLWLFILAGCASGMLAPEQVRQAEFLEKTTVKRGTAYTRALRWFDKNLRYTSGSPRVEDSTATKMHLVAGYKCNVLRKASDFREHYLAFELDYESIPGAVDLRFTQLRMEDEEGVLMPKPEIQLSSVENMELVRPCLKKMVAALVKAVESNYLTW